MNNSRKKVLKIGLVLKNIGIFLGQGALTIRFAYIGDKANPHL